MLRYRVRNIIIGAIDILVFLEIYQCHYAHFLYFEYPLQHSERGVASSELFGEQVPLSLHPNSLERHSIRLSPATSDRSLRRYFQP